MKVIIVLINSFNSIFDLKLEIRIVIILIDLSIT